MTNKARWASCSLLVAVIAVASGFTYLQAKGSSEELMPCSSRGYFGVIEDFCIGGYALVASYDALPKANQRETFRLQKLLPISNGGFVGSVDTQGQFRVEGDWETRTKVIADLEVTARLNSPERWPTVQTLLKELVNLAYAESRDQQPSSSKASCDPTNGWTLLKLREEPLRRCLRTVFLLDQTKTFNDRTQKIFANQTIRYSDGTTAPLSLKRKGMTDSDRAKVVKTVKSLDKKARALGGYH